MADQTHLSILAGGVGEWNTWRDAFAADQVVADLSGADLRHRGLEGIDFERANLEGADLTDTCLERADLAGANLRCARLVNAKLYRADLTSADLAEADFAGAAFSRTVVENVDLRFAHGLEHVRHHGPSTIGIQTVYRSGGHVPENFLRGAGVPEEFIVYSRGLIHTPVESYSCFISYSTKDQIFAERLYHDLQRNGVRCWFAPRDMQGGKKMHEQIDEAIRANDKLLVVLSGNSMSSEWVKTEISKARTREVREKCRVLFPTSLEPFHVLQDWDCFDADLGRDSAREIREYFIPDFSQWKDEGRYEAALTRLLRDLRSPSPGKA